METLSWSSRGYCLPRGRNRALTLLCVHRSDLTHTYTHGHTHRHIGTHTHGYTHTRHGIVQDSFWITVRRGDSEIETLRISCHKNLFFRSSII